MILGANLVAEGIQDPSMVRVYGTGQVSAEVVANAILPLPPVVPLTLQGGLSVGYRRVGGTQLSEDGVTPSSVPTWLWYAPVSVYAGPVLNMGAVDLAFGAGPSWVPWAELPGEDAGSSGTKFGMMAQAEARVHLRKLNVGLYGEDTRRSDVLLTLGAGGRSHHLFCGEGCGLDFGTLCLYAGVGIALP